MEFIASALLGGGTGIIGSVVGRVFGWLETREKRKNMEMEFAHELSMTEAQGRIRADELEAESKIVEQKVAGDMRTASSRHDMSAGQPYRWVISVLRLVRPVLTLMLIAITAAIVLSFPAATAFDIANQVVYLTSMAIAWWFGDRAPQPKK